MIGNKYDLLIDLIEKNQVEAALNEARLNLKDIDDSENEISLLKGRFTKNKSDFNRRIVRKDDYDLEYNRIAYSILKIIEDNKIFLFNIQIENATVDTPENTPVVTVPSTDWGLPFSLLIIIIIIALTGVSYLFLQYQQSQLYRSNQLVKFKEYKMKADTFFYHNNVDKAEEYYKKADSIIKTPEVDKLLGFCASVKRNGPGTYLNKDSARACDVLHKKDMVYFSTKSENPKSLINLCPECLILDTDCGKIYRYGDQLKDINFDCKCK